MMRKNLILAILVACATFASARDPLELSSVCRNPDGTCKMKIQNYSEEPIATLFQADYGSSVFLMALVGQDTFFNSPCGVVVLQYFVGITYHETTKATNNINCVTESQTDNPTQAPTQAPSASPSVSPSAAPSAAPSASPSAAPTDTPTDAPTQSPTDAPTQSPTEAPTKLKPPLKLTSICKNPDGTCKMRVRNSDTSDIPATYELYRGTAYDVLALAKQDTFFDSACGTIILKYTFQERSFQTTKATNNNNCTTPAPTGAPSVSPTQSPTLSPTKTPTLSPTKNPTQSPTLSPTKSPTQSPTLSPTPFTNCTGADVLVAVDQSFSIQSNEFQRQKEVLQLLVDFLPIGPDGAGIAMSSFGLSTVDYIDVVNINSQGTDGGRNEAHVQSTLQTFIDDAAGRLRFTNYLPIFDDAHGVALAESSQNPTILLLSDGEPFTPKFRRGRKSLVLACKAAKKYRADYPGTTILCFQSDLKSKTKRFYKCACDAAWLASGRRGSEYNPERVAMEIMQNRVCNPNTQQVDPCAPLNDVDYSEMNRREKRQAIREQRRSCLRVVRDSKGREVNDEDYFESLFKPQRQCRWMRGKCQVLAKYAPLYDTYVPPDAQ